jgi:hypothetical protein
VFIFYALTKVMENFDNTVHQILESISGHSIKYLLAAVATYKLIDNVETEKAGVREGLLVTAIGGIAIIKQNY